MTSSGSAAEGDSSRRKRKVDEEELLQVLEMYAQGEVPSLRQAGEKLGISHVLFRGIIHGRVYADIAARWPELLERCRQRTAVNVAAAPARAAAVKAKLTEEDVFEIRQMFAAGFDMAEISQRFPKVRYNTIRRALNGERWRGLDPGEDAPNPWIARMEERYARWRQFAEKMWRRELERREEA